MRGATAALLVVFGAACAAVGYVAGAAGRLREAPPQDAPGPPSPAHRDDDAPAAGPRRGAEPPRAPGRARRPGEADPVPGVAVRDGSAEWFVQTDLLRPREETALRRDLAKMTEAESDDVDPKRAADVAAVSRRIRAEAVGRASYSDVEALRIVAGEIERERELLRDARRSGTIGLLRALARTQTIEPPKPPTQRMMDVVGEPDVFSAHFVRHEPDRPLALPAVPAHDPIPDGAVLRFAEGVHPLGLDVAMRGSRNRPLRDVLVVGAGMDRTLVRLQGEIESDAVIENLTFRDVTIDCADHYLTDLRSSHPVTLRMERCRVVGFDMAAGGSVMFAARTAAFLAADCRFEAGFGRAEPGSGNLFRVDRGLLARMERCTFVGPFSSVCDESPGSTTVFADCTFEGGALRDAAVLETPPYGVRFERCAVTSPLPAGTKAPRRNLGELNPAWAAKPR